MVIGYSRGIAHADIILVLIFVDGWGHGNSNCYLKADSTESKLTPNCNPLKPISFIGYHKISLPSFPIDHSSSMVCSIVQLGWKHEIPMKGEGCMQISCVNKNWRWTSEHLRCLLQAWPSRWYSFIGNAIWSSIGVGKGEKHGGDDGIQWRIVIV